MRHIGDARSRSGGRHGDDPHELMWEIILTFLWTAVIEKTIEVGLGSFVRKHGLHRPYIQRWRCQQSNVLKIFQVRPKEWTIDWFTLIQIFLFSFLITYSIWLSRMCWKLLGCFSLDAAKKAFMYILMMLKNGKLLQRLCLEIYFKALLSRIVAI